MNVRVEYDPTPIRHVAVECPACGRWYNGRDITDREILNDSDLYVAEFTCPVCGAEFGGRDPAKPYIIPSDIRECADASEVYAGCLRRKEVWE